MNQHFKIVVAAHNAERFIERCLLTIKHQSYMNFVCTVVDDRSTDSTLPLILRTVAHDMRFRVIAQPTKQPSHLLNQCQAIDSMKAKDDDVIVIVDGDDWFPDNHALARLAESYFKSHCWMTYGTPVCYDGGPDYNPYYRITPYKPEDLRAGDIRRKPWAATHLRTFKFGLWRRIDQSRSFYDSSGNIVEACVDMATMFPMLEMAAERALCINEPMLVYNRANPLNIGRDARKQARRLYLDAMVRGMTPYERITSL